MELLWIDVLAPTRVPLAGRNDTSALTLDDLSQVFDTMHYMELVTVDHQEKRNDTYVDVPCHDIALPDSSPVVMPFSAGSGNVDSETHPV